MRGDIVSLRALTATVPQSEQSLVDNAASYIRSAPQRHSLLLEEFRTSYGIPDLLEITFDQRVLEKRLSVAAPRFRAITPDAARLLCLLESKQITKREALIELHFSTRRLLAAIDVLADRNLLEANAAFLGSRRSGYDVPLISVVAYEAKLTNWMRAIFQAQRHLWFAEKSFVLMPTLQPRVAGRLIQACQKHCVGLTVFQHGFLRCVVEAESSPVPRSWFRCYLNELVVDIKSLDVGAI